MIHRLILKDCVLLNVVQMMAMVVPLYHQRVRERVIIELYVKFVIYFHVVVIVHQTKRWSVFHRILKMDILLRDGNLLVVVIVAVGLVW